MEPNSVWTHVELSRLYRSYGDLTASHKSAQTANDAATDDRDHSVTLNEIGDVLVAQGDLAKALESFQASHTIFERLAEADPSNAGLQRDLSFSHNMIGNVQHRLGSKQYGY